MVDNNKPIKLGAYGLFIWAIWLVLVFIAAVEYEQLKMQRAWMESQGFQRVKADGDINYIKASP